MRSFSEGVQADFVLKSGLSLGRVLLELPKQNGIQEDWLGEPWALIASTPSLPISGIIGEPRIMVVDEGGKININGIVEEANKTGSNPFAALAQASAVAAGGTTDADYWKNALREVFVQSGMKSQQYPEAQHRTLGNVGFAPDQQVAVIHDWIDADNKSHSSASFDGEGIESSADPTWFYNRPLKSLTELLLVPGMTAERLGRVAPFVHVSLLPSNQSISVNINTAPLPVLIAMGFPPGQAQEMVDQRTNLPITADILNTLIAGDPQLRRFARLTSNEFSIYCRVVMPNTTHWLRASITVQGTGNSRKTVVKSQEFF